MHKQTMNNMQPILNGGVKDKKKEEEEMEVVPIETGPEPTTVENKVTFTRKLYNFLFYPQNSILSSHKKSNIKNEK